MKKSNNMNLVDYLKRSKLKTREDLVRFLDNFGNDATSWRDATQEIMDISRTSREYLEEYDNIKVDPVDFRMIGRTKNQVIGILKVKLVY
jgi:hypothetical protein